MTTHMYPPLGPEDWLVQEIQKELSSKVDDPNVLAKILNELISPSEMSIMQECDEAVLKVACSIKENDLSADDVSSLVNSLYKKYGWISDEKFRLKYHDRAHFNSEIRNVLTSDAKVILNSFEEERKRLVQKKKLIIKKYSLTDNVVHLSVQASELPHIRNLRREAIPEAAFHMRSFFQVVSDRLETTRIIDYFHWEIVDALKGNKVDMEKIDDRPSGFGLVFIAESLYVGDRAGAESVKKMIDKPVEDTDEIRGTVACFGKVTGIARVLFSSDEINRVEEGDILVTAMTTPDFVPAMKKCAAVVTDEGGISCHASIVAREMKKPCVIGTKVATQVFKDGDLIEVDAENGIVRKI